MVDWARDNTASTIWSCLAAHAAVLHVDGIERRPLADKLFGIFDCEPAASHPMTSDATSGLRVPHSRYNDLPERALTDCGYRILTRSAVAGVDMFARQDKSFHLFLQGHPEYEAKTLLREYRRDVGRYLRRERDDYPGLPHGYFDGEATAIAAAFRERALRDRREHLIANFPIGALDAGLQSPWRRYRHRHLRELVRISQRPQGGPAPADHAVAARLARLAHRRRAAGCGRRIRLGSAEICNGLAA